MTFGVPSLPSPNLGSRKPPIPRVRSKAPSPNLSSHSGNHRPSSPTTINPTLASSTLVIRSPQNYDHSGENTTTTIKAKTNTKSYIIKTRKSINDIRSESQELRASPSPRLMGLPNGSQSPSSLSHHNRNPNPSIKSKRKKKKKAETIISYENQKDSPLPPIGPYQIARAEMLRKLKQQKMIEKQIQYINDNNSPPPSIMSSSLSYNENRRKPTTSSPLPQKYPPRTVIESPSSINFRNSNSGIIMSQESQISPISMSPIAIDHTIFGTPLEILNNDNIHNADGHTSNTTSIQSIDDIMIRSNRDPNSLSLGTIKELQVNPFGDCDGSSYTSAIFQKQQQQQQQQQQPYQWQQKDETISYPSGTQHRMMQRSPRGFHESQHRQLASSKFRSFRPPDIRSDIIPKNNNYTSPIIVSSSSSPASSRKTFDPSASQEKSGTGTLVFSVCFDKRNKSRDSGLSSPTSPVTTIKNIDGNEPPSPFDKHTFKQELFKNKINEYHENENQKKVSAFANITLEQDRPEMNSSSSVPQEIVKYSLNWEIEKQANSVTNSRETMSTESVISSADPQASHSRNSIEVHNLNVGYKFKETEKRDEEKLSNMNRQKNDGDTNEKIIEKINGTPKESLSTSQQLHLGNIHTKSEDTMKPDRNQEHSKTHELAKTLRPDSTISNVLEFDIKEFEELHTSKTQEMAIAVNLGSPNVKLGSPKVRLITHKKSIGKLRKNKSGEGTPRARKEDSNSSVCGARSVISASNSMIFKNAASNGLDITYISNTKSANASNDHIDLTDVLTITDIDDINNYGVPITDYFSDIDKSNNSENVAKIENTEDNSANEYQRTSDKKCHESYYDDEYGDNIVEIENQFENEFDSERRSMVSSLYSDNVSGFKKRTKVAQQTKQEPLDTTMPHSYSLGDGSYYRVDIDGLAEELKQMMT